MSELSSSSLFDCRSDESCIGRIFLVHLSRDANPAAGHVCGRVQHVRSEDATHFASFAELSRFMFEHIEGESRAIAGDHSGGSVEPS
jgi:hypothetical protein